MQTQKQEQKSGKLSRILLWLRIVGITLVAILVFFSAFFFIRSSTSSANAFWGAVFAVLAVLLALIQIIPIVLAHTSESATVIQHFHLLSASTDQTQKDATELHTFAVSTPRKEKRNAAKSVFLFNEPHLPRLEDFFGRERERTLLLDRTHQGGSTSIVGPRRIGKTWLIDFLKLSISMEVDTAFQIAKLDGTKPDCRTETEFTVQALEALGVSSAFLTDQQHLGLGRLEQYVKDMKSRKITPILCIDEFEGFFHHQAFDCDFYAGLRYIAQNEGLILVIASKRPLIDLIGERCETSGFFNIFHQLNLKPFSLEEAEDFAKVKSAQAEFTNNERTYLLKYGREENGTQVGWLPMRLQLAGKMLLTDKKLARGGKSHYYRPHDAVYWKAFEEQLEETYRGAVR
jgi:hypothetical protein